MNRTYYRLTKPLANPRPDKRSKSADSMAVWPAGSVYLVAVDPEDGAGYVRFVRVPGRGRLGVSWPLWVPTGKALTETPDKEPAPDALDVLEDRYQLGPSYWLAVLIERGLVPLEAVVAVAKELDAAGEDTPDVKAAFAKHGL